MMRRGTCAGGATEARMLLKETAFVRLVSLKIPVLLWLGPRVLELGEEG